MNKLQVTFCLIALTRAGIRQRSAPPNKQLGLTTLLFCDPRVATEPGPGLKCRESNEPMRGSGVNFKRRRKYYESNFSNLTMTISRLWMHPNDCICTCFMLQDWRSFIYMRISFIFRRLYLTNGQPISKNYVRSLSFKVHVTQFSRGEESRAHHTILPDGAKFWILAILDFCFALSNVIDIAFFSSSAWRHLYIQDIWYLFN